MPDLSRGWVFLSQEEGTIKVLAALMGIISLLMFADYAVVGSIFTFVIKIGPFGWFLFPLALLAAGNAGLCFVFAIPSMKRVNTSFVELIVAANAAAVFFFALFLLERIAQNKALGIRGAVMMIPGHVGAIIVCFWGMRNYSKHQSQLTDSNQHIDSETNVREVPTRVNPDEM